MIKLNWVISSTISVLLTTLYKRIYENSEELLSITFDTKLNSFLSLNVVLCTMLLATKIIERTIFGEFRSQEFTKSSDRLINYLLLKVVFFVGAFTVTSINFLIVWSIWYSIMGSLYLATLLCKDRFEYLLHVNSKLSDHLRIYLFLVAISVTNFSLFYFLYKELTGVSISLLLLLSYENIAVFINSVQLFAKYSIYFSKIGDDQKGGGYFYTEITTDTLVHLFTVVHYLQILFKNGIYLTILDIVIFLNIYTICTALRSNFVSFVNFRKLETLVNLYPNVSQSELQAHNDNCAICREPAVSSAKKLPCSHIYHESCLRLWLQHCLYTPTCPTCRFPLLRTTPQANNSSATLVMQREQPIKKLLPVFERIQKSALKKSSSWASPASPSLYTPCKLEERSNDSLLERRKKILSAVERRHAQTQEL